MTGLALILRLCLNAEGVHDFQPGVAATPGRVNEPCRNAAGVGEIETARHLLQRLLGARDWALGLQQPQAGSSERLRR